jgi:hypothetical protein
VVKGLAVNWPLSLRTAIIQAFDLKPFSAIRREWLVFKLSNSLK